MFKPITKKILSMGLMIALLSQNALALTIKPFKDNQTIHVEVAASEVNRIFVNDDRIQAIRGLEGAYTVKHDAISGNIYLQPTEEYQKKIFSVFVTTELGRNLTLMLQPSSIPAQTIELKSRTPSKKIATSWEEATSYEQTIIRLIDAMKKNESPDGYVVIPEGKAKTSGFGNKLKVQLMVSYLGAKFRGEVLRLKNNTDMPFMLNPQDFYQANTKALALQSNRLEARATTLLFRVMGGNS